MASLAEMMDYAKAQQPRNGLAELASHFLEGAGQGYDAGHAEAVKNQENPLVTIDPAIAASVGLPAGQKARLDVYSKLVDAHAKLTEANASLTLKKEQDALDAQSTADANKAHMTGRAASLGDIGTNALAAGQENSSGGTVMSRLDQVVKDANAPATPAAGAPLEKKVTYSQSGGKVSKSTVYEPPTAPKALNPDQYAAVVSGKPADLAKAFPQGVSPDIAKMMSERQAREQAAHERIQAAQDAKDQADQNRLEAQAMARTTGIRGDSSVRDAEAKRDAAITVYNRINEIKNQGADLTPTDYVDLLSLTYKARAGASPTEQTLAEMRQDTAKGKIGKWYTYVTGKTAPASTASIISNLQDIAKSSGLQADALHAGYMKSHLIKPKGLAQDRWDPIVAAGRGTSFADATGAKPDATSGKIQVSNGKERLWIDPADAADAAKDGYQ